MNYKKEYKKYLISAILDNANNKIASKTLMVAFAIYLGIPDFWIGLYVVLDMITNVIQIFAAPLFSKIGQSKKVVLINYSIYRLASLIFIFIPFISQDVNVRTLLFFIPATIYAVTGELGYITFVNWRMKLIKKEDRGKFSATKYAFKNTVVLAFSLAMGLLLDHYKLLNAEIIGYVILFAMVFVIAAVDILIRIRTHKPIIKQEPISVVKSVKMPANDKDFRPILAFCGLYRFAIGIGTVFLNVFVLRYLEVNYTYYSALNIILALSEAIFGVFWAKKIKDRNWRKILIPMAFIYILAFSLLSIFDNGMLFYLLPIIYFLIGCGNGAYDLFDNIAIYENSKKGFETSYVTFERFIEGLVTIAVPILTSTIFFQDSVDSIRTTFIIGLISFIFILLYLIGKNKIYSAVRRSVKR